MSGKRFQVPESGIQALTVLAKIGKTKQQQLNKLLSKVKPTADPNKVTEQLEDKIDIDKSHLNAIIALIFGLYYSMLSLKFNKEEIVDEVIKSIKMKSNQIESLKKFLLGAIDKSFVSISSKTASLATANPNLFCAATIYTDIRPSFPDDFRQKTIGAIILHKLVIEYHENETHKRKMFTLDSGDLTRLKKELLRAEQKEEYLKRHKAFKEIDLLEI